MREIGTVPVPCDAVPYRINVVFVIRTLVKGMERRGTARSCTVPYHMNTVSTINCSSMIIVIFYCSVIFNYSMILLTFLFFYYSVLFIYLPVLFIRLLILKNTDCFYRSRSHTDPTITVKCRFRYLLLLNQSIKMCMILLALGIILFMNVTSSHRGAVGDIATRKSINNQHRSLLLYLYSNSTLHRIGTVLLRFRGIRIYTVPRIISTLIYNFF